MHQKFRDWQNFSNSNCVTDKIIKIHLYDVKTCFCLVVHAALDAALVTMVTMFAVTQMRLSQASLYNADDVSFGKASLKLVHL